MTSPPPAEDLFWKKRLFPELARLAWPITVSMLSYSLMTVVDTLFVGRLGASSLAAVAFAGVIAFTLLCFGIGMLRAIKVLVSQSVGASEPKHAREFLSAGLAIALGIGLISALAGQISTGFVAAWSPTPESGHLAGIYLGLRSWGAPVVLLAVALRETQYGLGNSRSPMNAAVVANLANIPLNATLIFGLGLGIRGAVFATLAAQVLELLLLVLDMKRRKLRPGPLRVNRCRQVLGTGWPLALEFFLDVGAFSALTAIVARTGEVQLAAHQITLQLCHFAFLPSIAVSEAASVLAGQAVGANQDSLVRRVAHRAALLNLAYVSLCAAGLVLFGPFAASWFSPDIEVQQSATLLLRTSAVLMCCFGLCVIPRAVLRGAGSERFSALVTVGTAWLIAPPIAYGLGIQLGWGALGCWLGMILELSVGLAILWWKLGSQSWLPGAERARQRLRAASAAPPGRPSTALEDSELDLEPASANPAF